MRLLGRVLTLPAAQVFVIAWVLGEKVQSANSVILSDQRESKDLGSIDDA
jgi:hypothetical protein